MSQALGSCWFWQTHQKHEAFTGLHCYPAVLAEGHGRINQKVNEAHSKSRSKRLPNKTSPFPHSEWMSLLLLALQSLKLNSSELGWYKIKNLTWNHIKYLECNCNLQVDRTRAVGQFKIKILDNVSYHLTIIKYISRFGFLFSTLL